MKRSAISIAIVLAGMTGIAAADGGNTLQPVKVSGSVITQCAPPDDHVGAACEDFDRFVRANFTLREIGMLFGASTAYPEYVTGGFERVQRRYDALVREYLAGQSRVAKAADVAAK